MKSKDKKLWSILSFASAVGLIASFIQIIERINFAEQPAKQLVCNINSVFNCTNVFEAWQSSVFGFSNSIMCLTFFAVILGVGLAGATSSFIAHKLSLIMHGFSIFFLLFGAWYLMQSTFVIGYICIFCLACYAAVITMNWAWLRLNYEFLPINKSQKAYLNKAFSSGADTFAWIIYAILFSGVIIFHFWR